jgi:ribosomal-protein-alanine N-acetyltransferase
MEDKGFRTRIFRSDDLERVMKINEACLPENYSTFFYRDLYQRFPKTFVVAEADDEIQGYIMCRIERGLSKLKTFRTARHAHVVSIAVMEVYRRRGIAFELLQKAMENGVEAYNVTECYLEVRVSNKPAINLYEKLGFINVNRKLGYYMDGEDAWVMAKPLVEDT